MRPRLFSLGEGRRTKLTGSGLDCFNEAEAVQPRRGIVVRRWLAVADEASMRPRLFSLGEAKSHKDRTRFNQSFNEAEAVQPRRGKRTPLAKTGSAELQ